MVFHDRRDAGRQLAALLAELAADDPVVVALPRGGVPVGYEVAQALAAPLEILAVRKLGAPGHEEYAVGAIAEGGGYVLDRKHARRSGLTKARLQDTLRRETAELERRVAVYRGGAAALSLRGRTVVVVDDGMATGLTDLAAVRAVRLQGPTRVVVAVPVASESSIALLAADADEVVCVTVPSDLIGVGRWYRDFAPVPDAEVLRLLALAERLALAIGHANGGRGRRQTKQSAVPADADVDLGVRRQRAGEGMWNRHDFFPYFRPFRRSTATFRRPLRPCTYR
jgi:putative phosphoribosyl transferase